MPTNLSLQRDVKVRKLNLLDRRQSGPIKSLLLVIIGWLVGWLVDNAVFSETALSIFLIFCMKLGDYKCRKVTEPDFWKKFLIWRNSRKGLQISPKSDTDIFLKNGSNDFFGFWSEVSTTYVLHIQTKIEWNLFFKKICNLEIFDLEIVKKLPKLRFLAIFSTLVFLDFAHNDRWVCLVVFLQFAGSVNVFVFIWWN